MSLFPRLNAVYSTYFGTSPPTRACVSVLSLPPGRRLKLEGVASLGVGRTCLHVQSLSYWAPANIGPYSQGIAALSQRLFIAGQIPLLPASLTLPSPPDFAMECALSLQHVRRAWRGSTEGRWKGWTEGGVCWVGPTGQDGQGWAKRVRTARMAWLTGLREMEAGEERGEDEEETSDVGEAAAEGKPAPMLFVEAAELPRGASVEWQVTFATGLRDAAEVQAEEDHASDAEEVERPARRRRAETSASEGESFGIVARDES